MKQTKPIRRSPFDTKALHTGAIIFIGFTYWFTLGFAERCVGLGMAFYRLSFEFLYREENTLGYIEFYNVEVREDNQVVFVVSVYRDLWIKYSIDICLNRTNYGLINYKNFKKH